MKINVRKRGNKWQYQFEAAKIDGKRKQITKSGFRTKKEALEAGAKALSEYNNIGTVFIESELSFNDFLDIWMKEYVHINLKQTTIENYSKKINTIIKPALGKYKLKSLTPGMIQTFINDKYKEGYSFNTLSVIKGILSKSMNYAVEPLKLIQANPVTYVELPSKRSKGVNAANNISTRQKTRIVVSNEMMNKIFERFPEDHNYYLPLLLGYRCGLRLGEVFALTWDDVDFDKKTLTIDKQVQWMCFDEETDKEKFWTITSTKYNSNRIIYLDSFTLNILHKKKLKKMKMKLGYGEYYTILKMNDKHQINELQGEHIDLINVRENGSYLHPRVMQHCSRVIHYDLGFKEFDFHSLRHTHTTMLIEAGVNIKEIQYRLGHKNSNVTLDIYSHVTDKIHNETVKILEEIFNN